MAIPPFIASMLSEMREIKSARGSRENLVNAAAHFVNELMRLIMTARNVERNLEVFRQCIMGDVECMHAFARLESCYTDDDWHCNFDISDNVQSFTIELFRKDAQDESLTQAIETLFELFSMRFDMEYNRTNWSPILLEAAHNGDVLLAKLAMLPNAHVRDALAQALEIARDAGHEEICVIIRARIAQYAAP